MKSLLLLCWISILGLAQSQILCEQVQQSYTGFCKTTFPNGQTKEIRQFDKGLPTGTWMIYNEKGELIKQIRAKEKRDSLIESLKNKENRSEIESENQEGNLVEPDVYAHFPGGDGALMNWINQHLTYPETYAEISVLGKVYTKLSIEADGSISEIKIVKGLEPELNACVVKLFESMPDWIPAESNGKKVKSSVIIPVKFEI